MLNFIFGLILLCLGLLVIGGLIALFVAFPPGPFALFCIIGMFLNDKKG